MADAEAFPAEAGEHRRDGRQKALLAAKIVLAVLVVALVVALVLLRTWPPLNIVMSGSMAPTIETGDIAIMKRLGRPAKVGDIVTVKPPQRIQERLNYPDAVIHRIVKIDRDGKVYTKGDARQRRDPFTVARRDIDTHVVGHIPGVGQIAAFFTSPMGLIWLGAGVLLFILLPYFELQQDRIELERTELNSLTYLKSELDEIAHHLKGASHATSRAPPPVPPEPFASDATSARSASPGLGENVAGDPVAIDRLDGEVREVRDTLDELVGAVGEYGHHLRSHTEILKSMSAASQDLAATVAALKDTLPATLPTPPPPVEAAPVPAAAAGDPMEQRAELLLAELRRLASGEWSLLDIRAAAERLEMWRTDVLAALSALEAGGRVETSRVTRDQYAYRLGA